MGFEAERDSVQNTLDVTNSLVAEKEREIEQQNLEVILHTCETFADCSRLQTEMTQMRISENGRARRFNSSRMFL